MQNQTYCFEAIVRIGIGAALAFGLVSIGGAEEPKSLPVYKVVKEGVTAPEGATLAHHLGLTAARVISERGGTVEFVDRGRYLTLPSERLTDAILKSEPLRRAIEGTRNKDATRKITPAVLDVRSTEGLRVLEDKAALSKASAAFERAGLTPQFGQAVVGHHVMSLYSKDGKTLM